MLNKFISLAKLTSIHPKLFLLSRDVIITNKTFLGYPQLLGLVENFRIASHRTTQPMQIAEFGVGRGGSSAILAWLINRYGGSLFLYDIFSRIPPPTEFDGIRANERYEFIVNKESADYYGNIDNLMDIIKTELKAICPLERIEFIQGKYEEVLPHKVDRHSYNLVHIDCDWYSSIRTVFNFLKTNLHPGAILQIDDYYTWQGAKKAVDEVEWLKQFHRRSLGNALVIDTGISASKV